MSSDSRRIAAEGLGTGLLVGLLFAIAEMIGSAILGAPVLSPWRAFASTILGRPALDQLPLGTAIVVGVVAHFALSAIYGIAFALGNHALPGEMRRSLGREAALGLLFGVALYLLNFQIVARVIYPWFRMANQPAQLIYHAIFFGLPLALLLALGERRLAHPGGAEART